MESEDVVGRSKTDLNGQRYMTSLTLSFFPLRSPKERHRTHHRLRELSTTKIQVGPLDLRIHEQKQKIRIPTIIEGRQRLETPRSTREDVGE